MSLDEVKNPYPVGTAAAVAFDAWVNAWDTFVVISKDIIQLAKERQQAMDAHTANIRITGRHILFHWYREGEYAQAIAAEQEAIKHLAQTERYLIRVVGRLPVIKLKW